VRLEVRVKTLREKLKLRRSEIFVATRIAIGPSPVRGDIDIASLYDVES